MQDDSKDSTKHPVGFYQLGPSDPEYHAKGRDGREARYMIEQLDGDKFYFPTKEDAEQFIAIHGLTPVNDAVLQQLRSKAAGE